ncbi:MAG: SDR family oxidoreductase [Candidatus Wolfebacteria bacterium]|nr:SDR family oxidoreductase [Candidatus Wolfebacteria bacterium]
MDENTLQKFLIDGRICIITGGAGFLGSRFAQAILDAKGIPVLFDVDEEKLKSLVTSFKEKYKVEVMGLKVDIANKDELEKAKELILKQYNRIDVLINCASHNPNPTIQGKEKDISSRFENFSETEWDEALNVGLKGAFLCSQVFGSYMASQNKGVILNIASDLGIIAPDQRIYKKEGVPEFEQPVKPVTYSVEKHAFIGLTKYLATYWAKNGVRVNAIAPGGVYRDHNEEFLQKLSNLIPMGRMADQNEYNAAVLFLVSDASSYMTGATLVIEGGRSAW